MPRRFSARCQRGLAWGTMATGVSLGAHLSAGAPIPHAWSIVLPWAVSIWAGLLLATRGLSLWRLSLAVAFSQFAFHHAFLLGTSIASGGAAMGHHHGDHDGSQMALIPGLELSASAAHAHHSGAGMWLAHLIGAAVTILTLHHGERLLTGLVAMARELLHWVRGFWLPPLHLPVLLLSAERWRLACTVAHRPGSGELPQSIRRRGPPAWGHLLT